MSKRPSKAQVNTGPLLQHTREHTVWPDLEHCTESQNTLTVVKSQVPTSKEYTIVARNEEGRISELKSNIGEEFWASYNPALDRYYVRSKAPSKPFRTPQHMTGHRAFFDKNTKTIIWMIPRNGSCTILASLMKNAGLEVKVTQPAAIWGCTGSTDYFFDETGNKLSNPEKWLEYKQCIVYQDPFYKCIRHMNYVLACNNFQLNTFFSDNPEKMNDAAAFIDTYLAIAEINTYNTKEFYEQHMMPQMFYHRTIPVQIESIIELDKLDKFIERELKISCTKANLEASIGLLLDDVTDEHRKKIEKIYGGDREIAKRFKDRWWK